MRMRWFVLVGVGLAGALAAPSLAVGPAGAARTAATRSLSGQVLLPGPGRALVDDFTLTASVPKGDVGPLRIRTTNESQLPAGIRAVAAISPARSSRGRATFTFYIAINNLATQSTRAVAAAEVILHFQVIGVSEGIVYKDRVIHLKRLDCEQLRNESNAIDLGFKRGSIGLARLQRKADQPSPGEEVFDFSAANVAGKMKPACTGVEKPDAGND